MSHSGKPISELGFDALTDRFRKSVELDDDDNNTNKPDFRELDLGSPVSPLRTRSSALAATTSSSSSSSSSSGSVSGRNGPNPLPKKSDSSENNHSGELSGSVESSPTFAARTLKPGHWRSDSSASHQNPFIYSGGSSVNSPPVINVLPAGNICPSGKILKTGMATRSSKTDVLGTGTGHYGHGSIMRGGGTAKSGGREGGPAAGVANPRGLSTGEPAPKTMYNMDPEELKRAGNEQYKKGHFAEALRFYDRAIALSPVNAAYHCNRAAALMGLKRLGQAVRECEEAIKLDPRYARAHNRLGSLFLR